MARKSGVKLAVELLRDEALSIEDRNLLTTTLLAKLGAVPVRAKISFDGGGRLIVDGRPLTPERSRKLRASARSLERNFAYKLIQETVDFLAVKQGIHENISPEQGLFAKAILWQHFEERELLARIASYEDGVFGD